MRNIIFMRFISILICIILMFPLLVCPCTEATLDVAKNMKGVWVASVYNLDYPTSPTKDVVALKKEATDILDNVKDMGINTVFLQVRPCADALYKSKIFPWSKYLTGKNGVAPNNNFDPLKFWVTEAHKRGIELHAWINPYRITKNGEEDYNALSINSPAKKYSDCVVKYTDGNYYFDPAYPEVRELVVQGILEIINNYEIDGIHLDDYFYPGTDFDDEKSYKKYGKDYSNIGDFRRHNVDLLIEKLHKEIKAQNKNILFGISPSGIWANKKNNSLGSDTNGGESYYKQYADTRKWVKKEWIDYIAPQLYWSIGYNIADYDVLVKWWSNVVKNTKTLLYIGMADYRTETSDKNNVWYEGKEIQKQLNMNKTVSNVSGEIHYRYSSLVKINPLKTLIANFYLPDEIKVLLDGKQIKFDQAPIIENGRTLVPLRAIFEELGATVLWNEALGTITANKGNNTITLAIGSKVMSRGIKRIELDAIAKIVNGRALVPLRAVSEAFDKNVSWDGFTKTITIK